jgi:beta-galactosidase/beta-glucuronidase
MRPLLPILLAAMVLTLRATESGQVDLQNDATEYPRPTLTRPDWLSLNGTWECGFSRGTNQAVFTNQIRVPFPVESSLAGTKHVMSELESVSYRRTFTIPPAWQGRQVWLHFEAVDWAARVWLNGKPLGTHQGGYDRFSFNLTAALNPSGQQELTVLVTDPTDAGTEPRGKQMLHPRLPFLHSASGIWQTVWLEPAPATSIESIRLIPDLDASALQLVVNGRGNTNATAEAVAYAAGQEVGRAKGAVGSSFSLPVPKARPWSPEDPFLYDLKITLFENGQPADTVGSYFGMRKISVGKGADGYPRLCLNNHPQFELGVLDQGYWPEGIYTAPNDEALRSDIATVKRLGFNLCRKHVKVEPERWYYWCDKLGVLVWQDMPNGDLTATLKEQEIKRTPRSAGQFETELRRMVIGRGNHPCIVLWIPFNQGWGQYDTVRITKLIKALDPSRLVMDASGWYDFGAGDVRSLHQYPGPAKPPPPDGQRAWVVGECGALGLVIPEHSWGIMTFWNITAFDSAEALGAGYDSLLARLQEQKEKHGLAAAVVTELTDVETEPDGFLTYDRQVLKLPAGRVRAANQKVLAATIQTAARN